MSKRQLVLGMAYGALLGLSMHSAIFYAAWLWPFAMDEQWMFLSGGTYMLAMAFVIPVGTLQMGGFLPGSRWRFGAMAAFAVLIAVHLLPRNTQI